MRPLRVVGLAALAALVAGCAGHAATMRDVREALLHDDLEEARARLADAGRGTGDLLFALEDGLLLFYAGDHELSNLRFEFVEQRLDDLYTKSLTRAALSLVTSDLVLRFEPRGIETFLVNFYRALNYLALGEEEEAWVEWRKLGSKLQFSRAHGDKPYHDPPFFHYVAGLGLEADDPNDAYVSFRLAEAAYRARRITPPPELITDLIELAAALGFTDQLEVYRNRYGDPDRGSNGRGSVPRGDEWGEVVVLVEDGLVAPIEEVRAYLPIVEERAKALHRDEKKQRSRIARALAREYADGRYAGVTESYAHEHEVAYVLPLAFPVLGHGDPAFHAVTATVGNADARGRVALDVSALQGAAFEDRLPGIYVKTIARALVKYALAAKLEDEAEEKHGEAAGAVVGAIANIANVVTERADTRAWLGLPHRIWMARARVPPGRHEVRLSIEGAEPASLGFVDVRAGERRFVSYRVF